MDQQQDSSLFGINVDQTGRAHLAEIARWAKFLSIMGFVVCGLIVIMGLFFNTVIRVLSSQYGGNSPYDNFPAGMGATMGVFYIVVALIYFIPVLHLFRFATDMKTALATNDQDILNTSFQNLKSSFRFVGILTIIMLSFWILALLVILLGVATGNSM